MLVYFFCTLFQFVRCIKCNAGGAPPAGIAFYAADKLKKLVGLGIIYVAVISEGLRVLVPALAQKLYKLPIPGARSWKTTRRGTASTWHTSSPSSCSLPCFTCGPRCCGYWLRPDEPEDEGWDIDKYRKLIVGLGFVILGSDACLFFTRSRKWAGRVAALRHRPHRDGGLPCRGGLPLLRVRDPEAERARSC